MRMKCEFVTDKLPVANQMQIVSLIKEAIKAVDEDYYKELYTYEKDKKNKSTKDFSFAVYMKDFKLQDEEFLINDRGIVSFTSPNYNFMVNLHNGIMKKKVFKYKDYSLTNIRISMMKEKVLESNEVIFNTLSPIVVRNKDNKFLDIDDKEYEKELNYIIEKSLQSYRGYGLIENIKISPIAMKKVVVKEEIAGFKELNDKRYLYVNAYKGLFKLEGNKKDLNLIYQLGLGARRNQGFGMVEIVK